MCRMPGWCVVGGGHLGVSVSNARGEVSLLLLGKGCLSTLLMLFSQDSMKNRTYPLEELRGNMLLAKIQVCNMTQALDF